MLHFRHVRRALRLTFTALGLAAAWTPSAPAAEAPTPQAIDANAEFLASPSLPAPPVPGKVCVVDTGVDLTTDLGGAAAVERYSVWGGSVDDVGGSDIPKHGTYVAGIIASKLDGQGSVGIWPQARIVSVRVFPDAQSGTSVFAYVEALEICRVAGASVVNLSLSGLDTATGAELAQLENRVTDLRANAGVNVVAAAGNTGGDIGYPGRFGAVFTVGATAQSMGFCSLSGRGPALDVSAPGCGAVVSIEGGTAGVGSGTSFAAPTVSAIIAALRAYRPDVGVAAAEAILLATARNVGDTVAVDAEAAFRAAGLDALVAVPPSTADQPADNPVATIRSSRLHPAAAPLDDLRVTRPRLRSATFRNGRLVVRLVSVPDFADAVFVVDGRRYRRQSSSLRLRLRRVPRRVSVYVDVPEIGRTPSVRVSLKRGHR